MNLQELLKQEGKTKHTLNTPKSVIVKLNKLIQSNDLKNSHKKTLKEIKGILVGKYPNKQALENSLKGLQSKINSLNEAKSSKTKTLLLFIVFTLISSLSHSQGAQETIVQNVTNLAREVISGRQIEIEEETWKEIKETLDKIEEVEEEPEEIISDLQRYSEALSEYNPNPEHMQIMITEARKRGIEPSLVLALVAQESSFRESAINNRNRNGTNDYGYFQLNSRWHEQHRGDVPSHIRTALDHLKWCLRTENGDITRALSRYNTGRPNLPVGERYAQRIISIQSDIDAIKIASR